MKDGGLKMNEKSKKIKALVLSMIMPGLGQIYNGDTSKGVSLFLGFAFSTPTFAWLATFGPSVLISPLVLTGFLFTLSIYILSLVDAYKRANLNSGVGTLHKVHVYLSFLFFGYFFVLQQLVDYTQDHLVQFYSIPSESMSPNVIKGDYIFAAKKVNCPGCKREVRRGDIATFVYPNNRTAIYIKRVIGLPGDKIEIKGTSVSVNGTSINKGETNDLGSESLNQLLSEYSAKLEVTASGETYPVIWKKTDALKEESFMVHPGQVFVLGDNRSNATDSRQFGCIPLSDLTGLAKQVFISTGGGVERIGKVLDLNH